MKPFNLKEALAGQPVVTRKGDKAFILNNLNDLKDKGFTPTYPLVGIIQNKTEVFCWTLEGRISLHNDECLGDIVGMWEEPRPTVTLTLPCPLKEPQEGMYFVDPALGVCKSNHLNNSPQYSIGYLDNGFYFATEEDAQTWVDALKNSRR